MKNNLLCLAEESLQIEQKAANLYSYFSGIFPEDAGFWWDLAHEEKNHAALFQTGIHNFLPHNLFPSEVLCSSLEEIKLVNQKLNAVVRDCLTNIPSRQQAFQIALQIENAAGELHFQQAMNKETDSRMLKIFQQLNQDDKDHVRKIQEYMNDNDIRIQ